jgi:signal transduction histidine kinase
VPAGLRDRIFEPFFRGDAEREHSGAGLGLAIAREIARAHGGDLQLQDCAAAPDPPPPGQSVPPPGAVFVATIARAHH